uniref:QWRF motif-containing protein 7 n=1 Tax=Ananas comosus var. bracteatus TaxID=296719 RepID=A0A6V7PWG1_ANACO|nr:unnamed protein product [Ananas comosus var. bracteatus]
MASSPRPRKQPLLQRSRSGASRFCHVSSSPDQPPPLYPTSPSLSLSLSRPKPPRRRRRRRAPPRRGQGEHPRRRRRRRAAAEARGVGLGALPRAVAAEGLFRRKRKEPSAKEEAAHQLRILAARLLQWRFANAHAAVAIDGAESAAQKKLFYAWVRVSELRKVLAAKHIMVQRRRQKMKLMRILNLQVQLLVRWEPLAKQHNEAVAVLGRVLGTACISLPLVEGAQANMVSLHRYFRESMDIMKDVEANTKTFYSKAETTNSILRELEEMIQLEIEGLQQLVKLSKVITTLEMHELSLRAHLIQAMDDDDDDDGGDISYLNY